MEHNTDDSSVLTVVRTELAGILGLHVEEVTPGRVFAELGLDSARAVEYAESLGHRLDRPVPSWLLWQYPVVGDFAAALSGTSADLTTDASRRSAGTEHEPIAIVGLGCRLPGGIGSPEVLWQRLVDGVDAVDAVPRDRWDAGAWFDSNPGAPGRMSTGAGGFLDDIRGFDADLFRISPAEAKQMDPQQRIALEVAWSALEDAQLPPTGLAGTATGVFFGAMFQEYASATGANPEDIGSHSATGWDNSVIPARIAYTLGLRGPVLGVSTACSSSLTAVHLAVRSLRSGESELALAGGVNLIMDPRTTVAMTKFGAMSPTGRCRAFDAEADGYVRGEGCGVVVLRRLSDALASGDRIYSVIRGSAVNNDGASNGLTAPNPGAQIEVLRASWDDAGISPASVSYVEAHGTGTLLGDPIEAQALGTVFGPDRDVELRVGSAKSNFGHLEPAAGVTGLLKTALALHHGELPPSLHFDRPNPHIDFTANRLRVTAQQQEWPEGGRRYAGVSSFGFGGSNAHVALEEAPYRQRPSVVASAESPDRPRLAFCFSGHGAQWLGMGRELLGDPVFRAAVEECAEAGGFPVLEALAAGTELRGTAAIQQSLYAVQVGLVRTLENFGIRPDVVFGQSIGEVAAAVCAGALSAREGARVITAWSALVEDRVDGCGTLVVAEMPAAEARAVAEAVGGGVGVAGSLSPWQTCLSGPHAGVEALERALADREVRSRRVRIDYPAHSTELAELAGELRQRLGAVRCERATIPFLSTVTAAFVDGPELDAGYWVQNMVEPMSLAESVAELGRDRERLTVVEIGPDAVLRRPVERTLGAYGHEDAVVLAGSIRQRRADEHLAELVDTLRHLGHVSNRAPERELPTCLPVAGKTEAALRANAGALAEFLEGSGFRLPAVARAAATGRAHLEHRGTVVAADNAEAVRLLRTLADGQDPAGAVTGTAQRGPLAMLFTGQGSQHLGMGRALHRAFAPFRAAFDEVAAALDEHMVRPLVEVVFAEENSAEAHLIDQTEFTQPALFAVEVALYRLWESFGVVPDMVAGHSVGEISAAHVAGVLDLADAARLVCARGRLMQACQSNGAMCSVEADEQEVLSALSDVDGKVSVAGLNTPNQTVVSGDEKAVSSIAQRFSAMSRKVRGLDVSHAFHSPHMDAMLDKYAEVVAGCTFGVPRIPLVSTVTGEWVDEEFPSGYWVRQVREPVRFVDAVRRLGAAGAVQYLECGPAPVLSAMGAACFDEQPSGGFVASVRPGMDEVATLLVGLGALHVAGRAVDWPSVLGRRCLEHVPLPGYAFQREPFWLDITGGSQSTGDDAFWQAIDGGAQHLSELLGLPEQADEAARTLLPYLSTWRSTQEDRSAATRLCFEDIWQRAASPKATVRGHWVLLEPRQGEADADLIAEALTAAGSTVARVSTEYDGIADRLEAEQADAVLSLAALDDTPNPDFPNLSRGELLTTELARTWARGASGRLWVLTRGAVAATDADSPPDHGQARCWGLGQVAALECGASWAGLVDLPPVLEATTVEQLLATAASADEEHVALRTTGRFVRRLRSGGVDAAAPPWRARGTVLITGGSGALAEQMARWAADRGAEHVVLASRSGAGAVELPGVAVTGVACDVTDPDEVAELFERLDRAGRPPTTVLHAAGVLDDRLLVDVEPASLSAVDAPKVLGAWNLHECTIDRELDAFVLFSSVVGTLGNVGQASYAMANAALDAVARYRRRSGLPAVSIAWGPWADGGMATGAGGEHLRRRGLRPIPPAAAVQALDLALAADRCLVVADVHWPDAAEVYADGRNRALLREIPEARTVFDAVTAERDGSLRDGLLALPKPERTERVRALLAEEAAAVLDVRDPGSLDVGRGFTDLGFDSMMALELSRRVQRRTGLSTPRTLTFDQPCIADAAHWVLGELVPGEPAPVEVAESTSRSQEPIAIVGTGLRMPGGALDLDSLWEVLASGRDTVSELPPERFDMSALYDPDRYADGKSYVRHASLLDDVASFDATFFGISPREAESMDPQHRLLLEATWNALESAGLRAERLRDSATGVFVGAGSGEYRSRLGMTAPDTYTLTGSLASFNAGRLAYHLGTQGPALAVDTACSSSLVALHLAAEALRSGQCDFALAGGVQVLADPGMFVALSRSQALSADGRSRTFSAAADGYGRGEGVGVVALMRLSDAVAQRRPVFGLVRGSAINHDGASSGITAPNGAAQQKVIREALRSGGLSPAAVDYVECHGTGTELGDPVEIQALASVYGQKRDPEDAVAIGTAKAVIGHLESAAGIAGVCKVLASLRYGSLPANPNSTPRNPNVAWDGLPVRVVDSFTPWSRRDEYPRRAGVSSFGLSGTNAHVIIEEAGDAAGTGFRS